MSPTPDPIRARTTIPCRALKSFFGCVAEVAPLARVAIRFGEPLRLSSQAFGGDQTVYVDARLMLEDPSEGPALAFLVDAEDLLKRLKAFDAKRDVSLAAHVDTESTLGLRQGATTRMVTVDEAGEIVKAPKEEPFTTVLIDADLVGIEKFLRDVAGSKTSDLVHVEWDGKRARFTAKGARAKDVWEFDGVAEAGKPCEAYYGLERLRTAVKAALCVEKTGLIEFGEGTSIRITAIGGEVAATALVASRET